MEEAPGPGGVRVDVRLSSRRVGTGVRHAARGSLPVLGLLCTIGGIVCVRVTLASGSEMIHGQFSSFFSGSEPVECMVILFPLTTENLP